MFDTHCHLNFKAFTDDAHTVVNDMAKQGVSAVVVGCDHVTTRYAIDLAQTFPNLWAAVGLHPTHVLDTPWDHALMKELALEDRVVAIGEVGLDWFRWPEDEAEKQPYIDAQYTTLRAAIALANEVQKPLILHSREAYNDLLDILEKATLSVSSLTGSDSAPDRGTGSYRDSRSDNRFAPSVGNDSVTGKDDGLRGTIHCFMGNWEQAQRFLKLGFMIGFTGVITYKTVNPSILEVVANMPLDRMLIETDAPYLTPEPIRSQGKKETGKIPRNIPQYVEAVAKKIAEVRSMDAAEIIELTEANAKRLFKI